MSEYNKLIGKWMGRHYCKDVKDDGNYIYCDKKTFINRDVDDESDEPFEDEYWLIVFKKRGHVLECEGSIIDQINRVLKPSDMRPQDFEKHIIEGINKWFSEKFSVIVVYNSIWD